MRIYAHKSRERIDLGNALKLRSVKSMKEKSCKAGKY